MIIDNSLGNNTPMSNNVASTWNNLKYQCGHAVDDWMFTIAQVESGNCPYTYRFTITGYVENLSGK